MRHTLRFSAVATASERRPYTMADIRIIRQHYTEGNTKGPEMAQQLNRTYDSFRLFIQRNPDLQKSRKT